MITTIKFSLSNTIRTICSEVLKRFFEKSVTAKLYQGTHSKLYYERSQHLMFAFKNVLTYEPIIQNKVKHYVHAADLVFDIGGNIGQYTLLFSELVGPAGKVVTLEPDYKNFSFLQFNVNINNLSNVTCLKKGVSHVNEVIDFYRDTETGGRSGSFIKEFVGEYFTGSMDKVESITFDSLIEKFGEPDFVKIDVEGFEVNVVKGLTYPLTNTAFIVEVREETKNEVFNYFNERNYQCYQIDYQNDTLVTNPNQIPAFANLIFKKK